MTDGDWDSATASARSDMKKKPFLFSPGVPAGALYDPGPNDFEKSKEKNLIWFFFFCFLKADSARDRALPIHQTP
jgi:hypothetical protein